jgi:hypothetical protein
MVSVETRFLKSFSKLRILFCDLPRMGASMAVHGQNGNFTCMKEYPGIAFKKSQFFNEMFVLFYDPVIDQVKNHSVYYQWFKFFANIKD